VSTKNIFNSICVSKPSEITGRRKATDMIYNFS